METLACAETRPIIYGYFESGRGAPYIVTAIKAPEQRHLPMAELEKLLVSWGAVKVPVKCKVEKNDRAKPANSNTCLFKTARCFGSADAEGNVFWLEITTKSLSGLLSELPTIRKAISDYFRGEH